MIYFRGVRIPWIDHNALRQTKIQDDVAIGEKFINFYDGRTKVSQ